jgi:hypothetical protein
MSRGVEESRERAVASHDLSVVNFSFGIIDGSLAPQPG